MLEFFSVLLHVLVILLTLIMSFQMHNYYILYMALAMVLHVTFKEFVANLCYCTPHKHKLLATFTSQSVNFDHFRLATSLE